MIPQVAVLYHLHLHHHNHRHLSTVPATVVHEVLLARPSDILQTCKNCKEAKSGTDYYESHKSWCKKCINKNHCDWLKRNPNAVVAESFRTRIRNKEDVEQLTGLKSSEFKRWLEFTKRFYTPVGYTGQIDIEHQYPLSKYDLTKEENALKCCNWKHLRLMTHEENQKKGCKMPSALDKFKQAVIVQMFLLQVKR
jgi:hypothetical protein